MTPRFCLRRSGSGSAYRLFRFRSSFDEVYFRYDPTVLSASRLWFGLTASSRTLHFGREPSNSTGGTFTHEATNFTGAHPKSEIRMVKTMQCFETAMICNRRRCIKPILHSRFQTMDGQMIASDGPFLFRISGLTNMEVYRPNEHCRLKKLNARSSLSPCDARAGSGQDYFYPNRPSRLL